MERGPNAAQNYYEIWNNHIGIIHQITDRLASYSFFKRRKIHQAINELAGYTGIGGFASNRTFIKSQDEALERLTKFKEAMNLKGSGIETK